MKFRSATLVATSLVLIGCASNEKLLIGYQFTNGDYAAALIKEFGEDVVVSSTNFYVLGNPWSNVEDNGLSISDKGVRYLSRTGSSKTSLDVSLSECSGLPELIDAFNMQLKHLISYSTGDLEYPDPPYLDGPDFVVEIHGEKANIVVEPKTRGSNFPVVVAAREIIEGLKLCVDA